MPRRAGGGSGVPRRRGRAWAGLARSAEAAERLRQAAPGGAGRSIVSACAGPGQGLAVLRRPARPARPAKPKRLAPPSPTRGPRGPEAGGGSWRDLEGPLARDTHPVPVRCKGLGPPGHPHPSGVLIRRTPTQAPLSWTGTAPSGWGGGGASWSWRGQRTTAWRRLAWPGSAQRARSAQGLVRVEPARPVVLTKWVRVVARCGAAAWRGSAGRGGALGRCRGAPRPTRSRQDPPGPGRTR